MKVVNRRNGSTRENLVAAYFKQGYSYSDIVVFMLTLYKIKLSERTVKRILAKLGLKRRTAHTEERMRSLLAVVRQEVTESGI